MKKILFYLSLTLSLFSCEKKMDNPENLTNSNLIVNPNYLPGSCPFDCHDTRCKSYLNGYCGTAVDTISIIKNSNNPYDIVGAQHNNGVRYILSTVNLSSTNLESLVLQQDKNYLTSIHLNADSFQVFYNAALIQGYFPFANIPELDSLGNKLFQNGKLSSYGNSYVQQMFSISVTYLNYSPISQANYSSFANNMITTENIIKSDTRISSYEKQVLLSSAAVGRYSASMWINYSGGTGSTTIANSNIKPLLFQHWPRWLRIAVSDIGGGIVGISGGPVGIIGGAIGGSIMADAAID